MNKFLLLSTLFALVLLAACGGGGSSSNANNSSNSNAATSAPAPTTAPSSAQSAAPTSAPAPTHQSATAPTATFFDPTRVYAAGADPETVVRAFFAALNAKQTDAALALVDDSVFLGLGNEHATSKDDVKTFLANNTLTYTITSLDFDHTTDSVTLAVNVSDGAILHGAVSVESGKITFMALGVVPG